MMHPDTVVRTVNDAVGVGVFATRRIPRGTLIWVRDPLDLALPHLAVEAMHPLQRAFVHRYAWREHDDWILCWDHARFVNHACDATCIGLDGDFEVALRDIEAGEQLTDDYRSLGLFEDPFDCLCGTAGCTGHVGVEDAQRLMPGWRRRYEAAMANVGAVSQPLLRWVEPAQARWLAGGNGHRSRQRPRGARG